MTLLFSFQGDMELAETIIFYRLSSPFRENVCF